MLLQERFDEFHSKRMSSSAPYDNYVNGFDESPKIVEIDTYKPKSRSRRIITNTNCTSDSGGDDQSFQAAMSSPLPLPYPAVPARLSIPDCRQFQDFDWNFLGEECRLGASATAHSTPRFGNKSGRIATSNVGVTTPSKSVCGDSFFRPYSHGPNYMANTQSFSAKLRSHSAPKQRPEPLPKKRLSLTEIMASRSSFSGVRMQRSCSQVQEDLEFWKGEPKIQKKNPFVCVNSLDRIWISFFQL